MKELKELLYEMELDKVVGGLSVSRLLDSGLEDRELLASGLVSKLLKEGYTAESLADRLAKLPLVDRLSLAKIYLADELASGLVKEEDELALTSALVKAIKERLAI